jgi:DNA-binding NarL/FixJ family response regulator
MKPTMDNAPSHGQLRMIVLKWDRLYGDLIRHKIWAVWPKAEVAVFQRGFDALAAIDANEPDVFITGVKIEDMDGLEHLEPFVFRSLPILVVTSRADWRTFEMLRTVRYDGIFDGNAEGWDHLEEAFRRVLQHELYISPSLIHFLRPPKNDTLEALTEMEQIVLSVIGDGSDNFQAGKRLNMSPETVGSHRKRIMGKLRLHHKGDLMHYALKHGYVLITDKGVFYPGFQRRIAAIVPVDRRGGRPRRDERPKPPPVHLRAQFLRQAAQTPLPEKSPG